MKTVKSLIQSKTFWFNVIKFIGGIFLAFTQAFPQSTFFGYAMMIEAVLALVLRMQTTQPISGIIDPQI